MLEVLMHLLDAKLVISGYFDPFDFGKLEKESFFAEDLPEVILVDHVVGRNVELNALRLDETDDLLGGIP